MPSPQQEQADTTLCASCGNPVLANAAHYNIKGEGPYHRVCVPLRDDEGESATGVTLTRRRAPILRVIK